MGLVSRWRSMSRGTERGLSSIMPFILLQGKPGLETAGKELPCPLHPTVPKAPGVVSRPQLGAPHHQHRPGTQQNPAAYRDDFHYHQTKIFIVLSPSCLPKPQARAELTCPAWPWDAACLPGRRAPHLRDACSGGGWKGAVGYQRCRVSPSVPPRPPQLRGRGGRDRPTYLPLQSSQRAKEQCGAIFCMTLAARRLTTTCTPITACTGDTLRE